MNYVFYDFETSGTDANFDQPIQLAAILTNENFEILDEPINEICKLKEGVIANPRALLVNKVDIELLKSAQCFYDFMDNIHEKLTSWSPATFIGYNSIFFDEEFLRNSLYQSLHDPYLTNTNSNNRADLYKIVLGLKALNINAIKFPMNETTGRISLKLESIAKENNIEQKKAHDALSDVYATIGVANLIKKNESDYWEECMNMNNPNDMIDYLSSDKFFFAAPTHATNDKFMPLSYLTTNPNYDKELAFFDLNHNPSKYLDEKSSSISSMIGGKNKPIKIVKTNKSSIILSADFIKSKGIYNEADTMMYDERTNELSQCDRFINNINQALVDGLTDYQIDNQSHELEKQLYGGGFYSDSDKNKIKSFKKTSNPVEKYNISKQYDDKRLREISYRFLFTKYPEVFTPDELNQRKDFIAAKVFSNNGNEKWCTLDKAKNEIEAIKNESSNQNLKGYINEIEKYIKSEEEKYKSYLVNS